ncbi:MAG: oxidoreductase coenzyme F420-dependent [Cyanobacteria bacterium RYN_339]|nr:oxidoreductase coenzyme F420-dependent [Cyanobacteria bacterium RYN_339]
MSKKVGVIGSGDVAKVLAAGFRKHGYEVMIGSRSPEKLTEWAAGQDQITAGTFAQVAAFGDIIMLAVVGRGAEEAVKLAGAANLAGKTVLDATNPISEEPPDHGMIRYFTNANESLMERLQAAAPGANFVKCFNSVGAHLMVNPQLPGRPTMFICGNSADAKAEAARVCDQFGWDAEDVGMVESARAVEALCQLWCAPGFLRNQWTHAFHLLKLAPVAAQ